MSLSDWTSARAYAEVIAEGIVTGLQKRVCDTLYLYGPMTANEIAASLGGKDLQRDCVRPRLTELAILGVVGTAGKRKCSVSGRVCVFWRLTGMPPVKPTTVYVKCEHCNGKGRVVQGSAS